MEDSLPGLPAEGHMCWGNSVGWCHSHCGRIANSFGMAGQEWGVICLFFIFLHKKFYRCQKVVFYTGNSKVFFLHQH